MQKIDGSPKTLKQLLLNTKYTIHYYQREYMWGKKQIEELIDDLTSEFLNYYKIEDSREEVMNYGAYFMGSVVLAGRENAIIDGQQRLTSLTLLLLYLRKRISEKGLTHNTVDGMIYSEAFGKKSFNINVEEREECLRSIFENNDFKYNGTNESVKNIWKRYLEIEEIFPNEINDDVLLYFIDWLVERVFFIEIVATTEQDAHKVFVSMNDRGLNLTPTEMLKGYLLSEISDDSEREKCNSIWKKKIAELKEIDKAEDESFIKNWLRAQYAETIRETKAGAENKDFDIIGSGFHKWVRDERAKLNLSSSEDYIKIIKEIDRYSDLYIKIKKYENEFNEDFKYIYYNARLGFTLQTQLLFAPLCETDSEEIINKKLDLVSKFIDMYIYSRVINYKSCGYNTIKHFVFNLTKKIRRLSVDQLSQVLIETINTLDYKMDTLHEWKLNNFTKIYMKHMLARITGFIEESSDMSSNYVNYVNSYLKDPFEVEHITPNHFEWYEDEYASKEQFDSYRDSIGDLLILPKSINASLNDSKYDVKVKKYCSSEGNIYAASLGKITYKNNPRFIRFIEEKNLNFKPYDNFGKTEIEERFNLVKSLVDMIWNIDNLKGI